MRCSKCGMEYDNNADFCPRCGTITQRRYNEGYNNGYNNYEPSKNNNNNTVMIAAVIILAIAIATVAGISVYDFIVDDNKKKYVEITPSPVPTEEPTPEPTYAIVTAQPVSPVPTKAPTPVPQPKYYSGYRTYSNSTYGFSCPYPDWFYVYDDGKKTLYTVESPDGQGRVLIDAVYTSSTPVSDRTAYINSIGGTVDYKTAKDDFFAVRVGRNGKFYYKYAKYKNGIRYSFEVIYPQSQHAQYDKIVNDIYKGFSVY